MPLIYDSIEVERYKNKLYATVSIKNREGLIRLKDKRIIFPIVFSNISFFRDEDVIEIDLGGAMYQFGVDGKLIDYDQSHRLIKDIFKHIR